MSSIEEHRKHAKEKVTFTILVVSDMVSSGKSEDISGKIASEKIKKNGHNVAELKIIPNNMSEIRKTVKGISNDNDVILVIGGTGLSNKDLSVDALQPLFSKRLEGFGEIFRYETYKIRGTVAWLSRADAGIINNSIVFIIPGSPDAVNTALEIILPEIGHAVAQMRKK
ncbi:MAG: MogA/MoaB family molybdenum cofactor biosynthesis protein [Thermoprotei archaeon]